LPAVQISCAFPPGPSSVEHARIAEDLGYTRAWFYDSPALYGDVWVTLAQVAEATERIGIGTAVIVPDQRHVMAQASAIATVEALAPGRLAVAIGTGFTARMAMGRSALSWSTTAAYIRALRGLLRGETVEYEGKKLRMLHTPGFAPPRPITTPIVVAANGPKGLAVARELGDGIMCVGAPQPGFDWCALLAFGTVLDDGEGLDSERVLAAAGPSFAVMYHAIWESSPEAVDNLPGGAEWRKAVEVHPEDERHLAVHEGHLVAPNERDQTVMQHAPTMLAHVGWTADAATLRERIAGVEAAGATEILYGPMGPDVERELKAFIALAS
jgi:5,10-methylenetetrahydromethanopterin reductase